MAKRRHGRVQAVLRPALQSSGEPHCSLHLTGDRGAAKGGGRTVLLLGQFYSLEVAQFSNVVRLNLGMDEEIKIGLISYLEEAHKPKALKKRRLSASTTPENQSKGGNKRTVSQSPLVVVQSRGPEPIPSTSVIHYTLDGRTVKMIFPREKKILLVVYLKENLLSPPNDQV